MEGCPKPVMISFDTKETSPAEFDSIKAYIRDYYQESGDNYRDEIQQLNKMRKGILTVTRDNQGCIALRRYYAQLQFLQSRFPMGEGGAAAIPFTWYDVYNGDPVLQEDIRFEQACVLFNLGGLYSQLGANESRTTEESMKTACTYFQCAAGIFQFLLDNFSLDSFADMTRDIIQLKLTIMLGQSQECLLEKSIRDNRKNTLIARICAQVEDFYEDATKLLENSSTSEMGSTLRKSWTRHLKIKMLMFRALENVYMSNQSDADEKFGDKVAFLKVASACIADAGQLSKNQPEEVVEPLRFIGDVVGNKYNAAVKDNDFVYHAAVPTSDRLPPVIGVSLVKPMPFVYDDKDVYISDIFKRLIPMKAHETSSLYSEKKSELLREISKEIEIKDIELSESLTSMQIEDLMDPKSENLPESLLSIHDTLATDQSQLDEVVRGAQDLKQLSHVLESNLVELASSLQDEEEAELAAKASNYQQIIAEIGSFRKDLERCQEAHLQADKTNNELVKHIEETEPIIRLLCGPIENIVATLPSQDIVVEAPNDEPVVQRIREILGKVEKMKAQRKDLLQQLREQITKDDITNLIVTKEDGNMEQFFKEHLQKHDEHCSIIHQNLSAQENILSALMETNAKYATTRKAVRDVQLIRDEKIAHYTGAYEMFKTIRERLRHGRDFYSQLQESIVILQSSVSEFKQRRHASRGSVTKSRDPLVKQSKKEAPATGAPQRPSAPKPNFNRSSSLNNDVNVIRNEPFDPSVPMVVGQQVFVPGQMQPGSNLPNPSGVPMMNQFQRPPMETAAISRFSSPPVSQMIRPQGVRPQQPLHPMQDPNSALTQNGSLNNMPANSHGLLQNMQQPGQQHMAPNTLPQGHSGPNQPMIPQQGINQQMMFRPNVPGAPMNHMSEAVPRNRGVAPQRPEVIPANHGMRMGSQPMTRYGPPNAYAGMNTVQGPRVPTGLPEPLQPVRTRGDTHQMQQQPPYSQNQPMVTMQHQGMRQPMMQPRIPQQQWQQQPQFQPQPQQPFNPQSRPAMSYQQPMRMQAPMMSQSLPTMLQQPLIPQQSTSRHQQRMPLPSNAIQPNQSQQPVNTIPNRPINQVAPQNNNRVIDDPFSVLPHQNQPSAQIQPAINQAALPPPLLPEPCKPRAMGNTPNCMTALPQSPQLGETPRMPVPYNRHVASNQSFDRQANPGQFTANSLPSNVPPYAGVSRNDHVPQSPINQPINRQAKAGQFIANSLPSNAPYAGVSRNDHVPQSAIGSPYTMQGMIPNAPLLHPTQEQSVSLPPQISQAHNSGGASMDLTRISSVANVSPDIGVTTTIAPTTAGGAVMTGGRPLMSPMAMGHSPLAGNTVVPVDNTAVNSGKSSNEALAIQQFQMQQFMLQQQQQMIALMQAQRHNDDALHIEQLQRQVQQQQLLIEKISRDQERISASKSDELMLNAKLLDELIHQKQNHPTPIPTVVEGSQTSSTPQMTVANIVCGAPTIIASATVITQATVADRTVLSTELTTNSSSPSVSPAPLLSNPTPSVPQLPVISQNGPISSTDSPSQQIPTDYPITSTTHSTEEIADIVVSTQNQLNDSPPIIPCSREVGTAPFYEPMLDKLSHGDRQEPDRDGESSPEPLITPSLDSHESFDDPSESSSLNASGVYQSLVPARPVTGQLESPIELPEETDQQTVISSDYEPSTEETITDSTVTSDSKHESPVPTSPLVDVTPSDSSPTSADTTESIPNENGDTIAPVKDETPDPAETARRSRSEQVSGQRPSRKTPSPDINRPLPDVPTGTVPTVAVTNPSQGDSDDDTDRPSLHRQFGHCSQRRSIVQDEKIAWKLYIDELDSSASAMHQQCMSLCRTNPRTKVDGFTQIWNDLGQIERLDATSFTANAGKLNVSKNRYRDILPWDHSRVILNKEGQDYINANIVEKLTVLSPDYIATQGPIPQCFADFWCMVWERDISVVVMLTNEVEGTKLKCHPYWPRRVNQPMAYGSIIVNLKDEEVSTDWKDRTMLITNIDTNESRLIKHLQFTSWPDYGTPDSPFDILAFMEEVYRFHSQQSSSPLLLHCSAGVGRTGTFACIYSAIREVNGGNGLIKIPGTVRKLRQCRAHMVQRKEQLIFCYQAILCHAQQFVATEQEKVTSEPMSAEQIDEVFDEVLSESDDEGGDHKKAESHQLSNLQRDTPIHDDVEKVEHEKDLNNDKESTSNELNGVQNNAANSTAADDSNQSIEKSNLSTANESNQNEAVDSAVESDKNENHDAAGEEPSAAMAPDTLQNNENNIVVVSNSATPVEEDNSDNGRSTNDTSTTIEDKIAATQQTSDTIVETQEKSNENEILSVKDEDAQPSCSDEPQTESVIDDDKTDKTSLVRDNEADDSKCSDNVDDDITTKCENINLNKDGKESTTNENDASEITHLKEPTTHQEEINPDTVLLDI